jgi:arylsulfatase A
MPFIENFEAEFFELYNVVKDPSQKNDLAYESPEKLGEMKSRYLALFEATQKDSVVWEDLPAYGSVKANHDKPAEFLRNQERFLDK